MNVVIIDDEVNACEAMSQMLSMSMYDIKVISVFNDPTEALKELPNIDYDVLFLDIQMPFMTGFDLLDKLEYIPEHIVFTTAYDQYAMKAFKVSASDYLLKPIDIDELNSCLFKLNERISKKENSNEQLIQLMQMINPTKIKKLTLATFNGVQFVSLDDIIRLESDANYTKFFLTTGESVMVSKPIGEYEKSLNETQFCRVHHSHIINLMHVKKYLKLDGGYAEMSDGAKVEISRRKKDLFFKMIQNKFE